jgi:hypothetical protein
VRWRLSDFAAKRLYKTAQGFNPGSGDRKGALKVAPDVGCGGIRPEQPKDVRRPPLSGRILRCELPRVKTLGCSVSRFAARSDTSRWDETLNIRSFVLSIFVALRSCSYPLSKRLQRSEVGWHTKCLMLRPSTKKDAIGRPKRMNHLLHTYLRQSIFIRGWSFLRRTCLNLPRVQSWSTIGFAKLEP